MSRKSWVSLIGLMIAGGILLAACTDTAEGETSVKTLQGTSFATIRTDIETGCQYIFYDGHSVIPRLDSTGKPMCGKGGDK